MIVRPTSQDPDDRRRIFERAARRGITAFVVQAGEEALLPPTATAYVEANGELARRSGSRGPSRVKIQRVETPDDLTHALAGVGPTGAVLLRFAGDRIIPLEGAIAHRGSTEIWTEAATARDAQAALNALEHGADRVIWDAPNEGSIDDLEAATEATVGIELVWSTARVVHVAGGGTGDRVAVDLTSQLRPDEGLLVGSVARYLFHVASEAEGSRFSRPRTFRVNAGAAHAYTLLADGSTRYLSELVAGDSVAVCSPQGGSRSARIGRLKIERRPLVQVIAEVGNDRVGHFVQDAETVRFSRTGGRVAVTELQPGEELLGVHLPAARHLGVRIDESIEER